MRFFIASGCSIATTHLYRCAHLAEQLRALGHEAEIAEWFDDTRIDSARAVGYDAIFLYRLPMSPHLARVIEEARQTGVRLIFDVDDLIFEPDLVHTQRGIDRLSAAEQEQHLAGVRRYLQTLEACDAVTVATPFLAELATQHRKPAFVHRNALGCEMLALANRLHAQPRSQSDRVVIGYGSGTPTHDADFQQAAGALRLILDRFPNTELWVVGPLAIPAEFDAFGECVRRFPLTDWPGWFESARQFDIALAPLELENAFCQAKSEIKFVEAAALGLPTIASRTEPYEDVITDRENGLLAGDEDEWGAALTCLVEEPARRSEIGARARKNVLQRYSPDARTADLAELLPRLLA
ncbi:MAG: glycosyltransferase family 4 protein [Chthoniobacterales bacterium]